MPSDLLVRDPLADGAERLHPVSLLFRIGSAVRSLLVPGIFVLFVARGSSTWEAWIMVLFLPAVLVGIGRYLTFRYRLAEDELIVRRGIFVKRTRHIPYARIQNIDLTRNVFHRVFGVADVNIETASGGSEAEARLSVLSLDAVRAMRDHVFRDRPSRRRAAADAEGPAPDGSALAGAPASTEAASQEPVELRVDTGELPGKPVFSMTLDDVIAYGLMSNRGFAVAAAALGLVWQFDLWGSVESFFKSQIPEVSPRSGLILGVLVALVATLGVWLLSAVWAVLSLYGFRLVRDGEDLRAVSGLLTHRSANTPRHRVQYLTVRERLVHRLFDRLSIRVETAGGEIKGDSGGVGREWLVPMARRGELPRLLREIQPETELDGVEWKPVDSRALRRLFRKGLAISLVLTLALALGFHLLGLLAIVPLVLLAWTAARIRVRVLGYALTDQGILFRDGWWTRSRSAVRFSKVQAVSLHQNPFDRRYGMAAVTVDTAGRWGSTHRIRIPFLLLADARRLMEVLRRRADETRFHW